MNAVPLLILSWPMAVHAQTPADEGISVAAFAVARDSASDQQASVTEFLMRQSFERNPRYSVLDVEGFLSDDAPNPARDHLQKAQEALKRGREMYDAFEIDPAISTLTRSVLSFERAAAALADPSSYVDALLLLGATYGLKADKRNARASFGRALTVDRRAALSGGGFPPSVVEIFEATRDRMAEASLSSLSVYANPAAAEVFVDGIFRGSAPLTIERLPAGRHLVRVYRSGYASFGKVVELEAGVEETLQAALRPTPQAAQFEGILRRAGPEATQDGMGPASQELGAWLRVDQLLVVLVTASGDDVTLQAAHYDAAGGTRIHAATRTFAFSNQRFRADVEEFFVGEFRQAQLGVASSGGTANAVDSGMAPVRRAQGVHPGFIWGGVSVAGAVVLTAVGVVFTVFAIDVNDQLSKLPQTDPRSDDLMTEGKVNVGVAAAGYSVGFVAGVVAFISFIIAATAEESVETILAEPGTGGDVVVWPGSAAEVAP